MSDNKQEWETLKVDNDYEINTDYPYQIRRKDNGYIISEWEHQKSNYIQIKLNGQYYYKHVVIALQWIENDDPENKVEVEHRNRIRTDYHIENLCWKTRSKNALNRTGWGQYKYEYVDELPIDVVPIILYKGWEFEGYFMDQDGEVWFDNGEQFRKIRISKDNKVRLWDINHVNHNIGIRGLRREFI
ncbi:hypothetical protein M9Y10_031298 [Tritrichomonas musculus]|uniref:HNH nuclease domain-containing protein n=1 Tax=Tritrichomonas musculus TaxID=1915356 RepID=A0ABR2H1C9_9EUKA